MRIHVFHCGSNGISFTTDFYVLEIGSNQFCQSGTCNGLIFNYQCFHISGNVTV